MPAVLASSAVLSRGISAYADIDDWLKGAFGSIREGAEKDNKEEYASLAMADELASRWVSGEKIMDRENLAELKSVCKSPERLKVVIESKNPEALLEKCFVDGK